MEFGGTVYLAELDGGLSREFEEFFWSVFLIDEISKLKGVMLKVVIS